MSADVWAASLKQSEVWFSDFIISCCLSKSDFNSEQVWSKIQKKKNKWMKSRSAPESSWIFFGIKKKKLNVNMVTVGTNYHLICSFSLKIRASSFRRAESIRPPFVLAAVRMKTTGPWWFVPPGPSLSWVSSQHFFTGRMLQIRAAHCVQHALHRHIL